MPAGHVLTWGERDAVEPGGRAEDAFGEDRVELEVLGHLIGIDAERIGPVLRQVIFDVLGCDFVETVAFPDRSQFRIELSIGGVDQGGDDIGRGIGIAGGLIVDGKGRVRGIAEQVRLQRPQRRRVRDLGARVAVAAAGAAGHRVVQHVPARLRGVEGLEHELLGEVVQRQQIAVDAALGRPLRGRGDPVLVHPDQRIGLAEVDGQFPCVLLQGPGEGGLECCELREDRGHLLPLFLAEAGSGADEELDGQLLLPLVLGVEVGHRDLLDAMEEIDVEQDLGAGRRQRLPHLPDGVGEFGTEVVGLDGADHGGDAGHRHERGFEPHGGGEERRLGLVGDDPGHLGAGEISRRVHRGQQRLRGDGGEVRQ